MVATNAVPIGCRVGEHRCAACSKAIDLEHVIFDCPAAIAFWQLVLKAWASVTPGQSWADAFLRDTIMDQECLQVYVVRIPVAGSTSFFARLLTFGRTSPYKK